MCTKAELASQTCHPSGQGLLQIVRQGHLPARVGRLLKDLKQSTRQRFISIEFDYPPEDIEAEVVRHESDISKDESQALAKLGAKIRNLKDHGLPEGASTRLLIYAGRLMKQGIPPRLACKSAIVWTVTDDFGVQRSVEEVVSSIFP